MENLRTVSRGTHDAILFEGGGLEFLVYENLNEPLIQVCWDAPSEEEADEASELLCRIGEGKISVVELCFLDYIDLPFELKADQMLWTFEFLIEFKRSPQVWWSLSTFWPHRAQVEAKKNWLLVTFKDKRELESPEGGKPVADDEEEEEDGDKAYEVDEDPID